MLSETSVATCMEVHVFKTKTYTIGYAMVRQTKSLNAKSSSRSAARVASSDTVGGYHEHGASLAIFQDMANKTYVGTQLLWRHVLCVQLILHELHVLRVFPRIN